jgi:hypothetical protein
MNWKGCRRKCPQPDLVHYPVIFLERLRTTRHICQDSLSPDRDLEMGSLEYEARVLLYRHVRCDAEFSTKTLF